MDNNKFEAWCEQATRQIRYKPDRKMVAKELMAHLEDAYDACTDKGMAPEEAKKMALAQMGSAKELAPQLASIHKPWLGYLFSLVRAAAVTAALFAIFYGAVTVWSLMFHIISANRFDSLPANFGTLDYYAHPNVSDRSDGRYYQVTEAVYREDVAEFYVEIRTIYWPHLRNFNGSQYFWAVDSLGNYYASIQEAAYDDIPSIKRGGYSTSDCIGHYHLLISDFDCEAQWVELHYDRDGRDIVLRIDLTGGDGHGTA